LEAKATASTWSQGKKTKQSNAETMTLFELRKLFEAALPVDDAPTRDPSGTLETRALEQIVVDELVDPAFADSVIGNASCGLRESNSGSQLAADEVDADAMGMLDALAAEQAQTGGMEDVGGMLVDNEILALLQPADDVWDGVLSSTDLDSSPSSSSSSRVQSPQAVQVEQLSSIDSLAEQLADQLHNLGVPLASQPLSSRNTTERKEWTDAEDATIQQSVELFGCRWRRIAQQLPGRSDDAVRNRWNRLRDMRESGSAGSFNSRGRNKAAADSSSSRRKGHVASTGKADGTKVEGARNRLKGSNSSISMKARKHLSDEGTSAELPTVKADGSKPERMSWTREEDATIIAAVQEIGNRWFQIAQRLPGRTDHAIRNRYHRLLSMSQDCTQLSFPVDFLGASTRVEVPAAA